jgi:penicillin G amidase
MEPKINKKLFTFWMNYLPTMKVLKFSASLLATATLVYALNTSWQLGSIRIPPLGKFLDPAHGFWQNAETNEVEPADAISISGLIQPVSIVFDSLLIPHIFAQNDADLYLAQGYITAKYRLWQMEFQTHAASGRISELIGAGKDDAVLKYDRGQRRQGMVFAAQNTLDFMLQDPIASLMVTNYTRGVNAYIESLQYETLPLEYKLMDYEPEAWTPLKCALLLKSMAQTLNSSDKDIEMTNALKLFGAEMVELLYPDREPVGDPIVSKPGSWSTNPIKLDTVPLALPESLLTVNRLSEQDPTIGSNNWAVSGSKTTSGYPIVCNDPHLTITLPSIWYVVQLNAPGINTMGASLPGAPGVISGYNDSIAWGVTNAQRDLVDWFKITFDETKSNYLLDGRWIPVEKVVEKFKPRGRDPFYDTILFTKWGPVTFDDSFGSNDDLKNYAYRWIAHDASEEVITFYKLNRAKNHADYMEALDHFYSPAQNFVFASASGDVAMRVQGKFPVRRKYEGKFVLDGSKSTSGWQAFIPFEQNVMDKNPARGFVSSANQYPVDETYPYYITARNYEAYRNRRINHVLKGDSSITIQDMMALQNDNYNLKAAESLPFFLSQLDSLTLSNEEMEVYTALKKWDFNNDVQSIGASLYEVWWDQLMPLLWDEMRTSASTLSTPTTWNTIHLLKTQPTLSFWDIKNTPETETAKDVIRKAFVASVKQVNEWKKEKATDDIRWADYKDTYIQHLARLAPFSFKVQHGGNHDIVNASTRTHGPSWRMVVSMEPGNVQPFAVYPGGQSGNPGSKYYSNMLEYWSNGKYFNLLFPHDKEKLAPNTLTLTQLNPAGK